MSLTSMSTIFLPSWRTCSISFSKKIPTSTSSTSTSYVSSVSLLSGICSTLVKSTLHGPILYDVRAFFRCIVNWEFDVMMGVPGGGAVDFSSRVRLVRIANLPLGTVVLSIFFFCSQNSLPSSVATNRVETPLFPFPTYLSMIVCSSGASFILPFIWFHTTFRRLDTNRFPSISPILNSSSTLRKSLFSRRFFS
ncbi:hypothetical protein ATCV1_z085L [Acanthocystis turfacea chlorella virus 1]|uniref:Uncharacterized protein z085L n=1 Tax=Chlorovirus heliozoae TaxID=322019 RepID=A7K845_9PHYC|nr:hypothetical protein ATCV1_z085L [Acanthocystis turfacea chlorella virus 1]ABT16219.1 hypothetical protein ATCV1_z085L [Acanthocystis turfacea chlorella virus 1]